MDIPWNAVVWKGIYAVNILLLCWRLICLLLPVTALLMHVNQWTASKREYVLRWAKTVNCRSNELSVCRHSNKYGVFHQPPSTYSARLCPLTSLANGHWKWRLQEKSGFRIKPRSYHEKCIWIDISLLLPYMYFSLRCNLNAVQFPIAQHKHKINGRKPEKCQQHHWPYSCSIATTDVPLGRISAILARKFFICCAVCVICSGRIYFFFIFHSRIACTKSCRTMFTGLAMKSMNVVSASSNAHIKNQNEKIKKIGWVGVGSVGGMIGNGSQFGLIHFQHMWLCGCKIFIAHNMLLIRRMGVEHANRPRCGDGE